MKQIDERLYDFLDKVKRVKVIRSGELQSEELFFAEELVKRKLLSKLITRIETIYSYGSAFNHEKDNL